MRFLCRDQRKVKRVDHVFGLRHFVDTENIYICMFGACFLENARAPRMKSLLLCLLRVTRILRSEIISILIHTVCMIALIQLRACGLERHPGHHNKTRTAEIIKKNLNEAEEGLLACRWGEGDFFISL